MARVVELSRDEALSAPMAERSGRGLRLGLTVELPAELRCMALMAEQPRADLLPGRMEQLPVSVTPRRRIVITTEERFVTILIITVSMDGTGTTTIPTPGAGGAGGIGVGGRGGLPLGLRWGLG